VPANTSNPTDFRTTGQQHLSSVSIGWKTHSKQLTLNTHCRLVRINEILQIAYARHCGYYPYGCSQFRVRRIANALVAPDNKSSIRLYVRMHWIILRIPPNELYLTSRPRVGNSRVNVLWQAMHDASRIFFVRSNHVSMVEAPRDPEGIAYRKPQSCALKRGHFLRRVVIGSCRNRRRIAPIAAWQAPMTRSWPGMRIICRCTGNRVSVRVQASRRYLLEATKLHGDDIAYSDESRHGFRSTPKNWMLSRRNRCLLCVGITVWLGSESLCFSIGISVWNDPEYADIPVPVVAPGKGKTETGRLWTSVRDDRPAVVATLQPYGLPTY